MIPRAWIRDTLTPDHDTVAAFASTADARELAAGSYYRNQFWVVDPTAPIYMGSGINGQTVFVHGPAEGRDREVLDLAGRLDRAVLDPDAPGSDVAGGTGRRLSVSRREPR